MTEQYARFDKISFDDINDKYDPFSLASSYTLRNSYLTGGNPTKTVDLSNLGKQDQKSYGKINISQ